jgi:hypothetical protein
MALTLFKRSPPDEPAHGPARIALNEHRAMIDDLLAQRAAIQKRIAAVHDDERIAADSASKITALRDSIDARLASARYADEPEPDVNNDRRSLAALEAEHPTLAERARTASLIVPRYESTLRDLHAQTAPLIARTDRLLWAAIIEDMASLQPSLAEAEAALRKVHREVFMRAHAADALAIAHGMGTYVDWTAFEMLRITVPRIAPFTPDYGDDIAAKGRAIEAEMQRIRDDSKALAKEAEAYVVRMLNDADA